MILSKLIITLFVGFSAHPFDNQTNLFVTPDFLLTGNSCSSVHTEAKQIYQWGRPEYTVAPQTQCPLALDNWLHPIADRRQRISDVIDGSNCWNTALHTSGVTANIRFTSDAEFSYWLNSPYCKNIHGPNQRPGDIMAIRTNMEGQVEELHGFVYISDSLSFSKGSAHKSAEAGIIRTLLVLQTFRVYDPDCYYGRQEHCTRWVDHFRCDFSKLASDRAEDRSADYLNWTKQIDEIAQILNDHARGQSTQYLILDPRPGRSQHRLDAVFRNEATKQLNELKKNIEKKIDADDSDPFFWKALWLRADSLFLQLNCKNRPDSPCRR